MKLRRVAWSVRCVDAVEGASYLQPRSVGFVLTDPPYGIKFMGRDWDKALPDPHIWTVLRLVIKPSHFMAVFGHPRMFHRLAVQIEDAGWVLYDTISWLYAQGMPKSKHRLKPGWEPILIFRSPDRGSTAVNPLNVDAGRIPAPSGDREKYGLDHGPVAGLTGPVYGDWEVRRTPYERPAEGRWPANVALDEPVAAELDATGPFSQSRRGAPRRSQQPGEGWGTTHTGAEYTDAGGPSRFFFCAKATRIERDVGLPPGPMSRHGKRVRPNNHPTVKPVTLLRWLIAMFCPPGELVLDPFVGSGSTGIASVTSDPARPFLGYDNDAHAIKLSKGRIAHWARLAAVQADP